MYFADFKIFYLLLYSRFDISYTDQHTQKYYYTHLKKKKNCACCLKWENKYDTKLSLLQYQLLWKKYGQTLRSTLYAQKSYTRALFHKS